MQHAETSTESSHEGHGHEMPVGGLAVADRGFSLSVVEAPAAAGVPGQLGFRIEDAVGRPVRSFAKAHERELHLIVVRTDGEHFQHVHPVLDRATGWWSLPWQWSAAGAYRVFVDFAPGEGANDAGSVVLSRLVQVPGMLEPGLDRAPSSTSRAGGFDVTVTGDLLVGGSGPLTITVEREGSAVRSLEPYLGAFGHLVALREGDLGYLHVHPEGSEPSAGDLSGPDVVFHAQAPTAGRYWLFFDFQVDGAVHTARFALDARRSERS
ncbi:hypothetical protein [Agrococcus sp. Marseille-P2731]|uniref:hypothetical protein n=1 Tax=Agrococcus sp. Marseille-P2731 TaxID=1841862 RepID=UPI000B09C0E0|nr:hypothetical protein [Agrococcus sp. Marseille-P2731]